VIPLGYNNIIRLIKIYINYTNMRSRRRDQARRIRKLSYVCENEWNHWAMKNPQGNFSEWIENKMKAERRGEIINPL
jgi:hypothetical protein